MDETIAALIIVPMVVLGLPWIIFHYITRWKSAASLTREDEDLLDELHDVARRLDDRMCSIERILTAENPSWRQVACDPVSAALDDRSGSGSATMVPPLRSNRPERSPR
jgi:phage shock protein B